MAPKKKRGKKAAPRAPKKKDERTVAEKMRDHLREQFKDPEAAHTFEGIGLSSVREVMPTRLDVIDRHVVGIGGLPYGRIVEVRGGEDVGKSSFINHLLWAAQQDGAVASLGDAERKVQPGWVDVFKVDRPNVLLLPANTIEEYLESIRLSIKKFGSRHKMVFCLDSVSTAQPQKALDEDLTDAEIPGAAAAAWSRGLRDIVKPLSQTLAVLVLVNQLRSKIGVLYGPTEESSGGRAIRHYSTLRLEINHGKSVKNGEHHTGKWCNVRSIKNHLGPQYKKAGILLNFERGFDDARSTLLHAKEVGAVDAKAQSVKEARKNLGWLAEADEEAPDELVADVEVKEGR